MIDEDHSEEDLQLLDQESQIKVKEFIGPINLVDDPIPDIMIKVREKQQTNLPTLEQCKEAKEVGLGVWVYGCLGGVLVFGA